MDPGPESTIQVIQVIGHDDYDNVLNMPRLSHILHNDNISLKHTPMPIPIQLPTSSSVPYKPKLILHVGPQKTATTSIQLNLLGGKFGDYLKEFDNYQTLNHLGYLQLQAMNRNCIVKRSQCEDDKDWNEIHDSYRKAHDKAMDYHHKIVNGDAKNGTNATELITVHSCENFSTLEKSDFALEVLKGLFEKWDLDIIVYYRPVLDWLPSMYSQHRKHQLQYHYEFIQHYHDIDNEDTIGQYWGKYKELIADQDTLGTHQFYEKLSEKMELSANLSFGDVNTNAKPRIQVFDMHSKLGPEMEFLIHLPHTNHSQQHYKDLEKINKLKFNRQNKGSLTDKSMHDLIITEAWRQNLISIGRYNATVRLHESMKAANITIRDLPQSCISEKDRDILWKRHLASHSRYIKSASVLDGDQVASMKRDFDEKKLRLCSVNATAALHVESLRRLFDDCTFHSQFLLDLDLKPTKREDVKWAEKNCTV